MRSFLVSFSSEASLSPFNIPAGTAETLVVVAWVDLELSPAPPADVTELVPHETSLPLSSSKRYPLALKMIAHRVSSMESAG